MSVNDRCIENVVVSYQFHAFDARVNDQCFFNVENTDSLKKLDDFFTNQYDVDIYLQDNLCPICQSET